MKIVMIHGQTHLGCTYHMGKVLVEQLGENNEVEEFFLPKDLPMHCTGCYRCLMESEQCCPHYELVVPIKNACLNADLLIFTTPVYCLHTTSGMKAFLEHCFTWFLVHQPNSSFFTKRAVILSAGAGGGMSKAIKDIKDSLSSWGISSIYSYGVRSAAMGWNDVAEKNKEKMRIQMNKLAEKIKAQEKGKVSLYTKGYFMVMRLMHLKGWSVPQDTAYWQKQGWLDNKRPWK